LGPSKLYSLSALFILIGISILVAGSFLIAFLWSVRSGQYDDDYTPSVRMLFDDPQKNNIKLDKEDILTNSETISTPIIIKK
jgi:cbb3-type cytochrome oxidase maturation protein